MANTLTYTQGGYTVTISSDGADLTKPPLNINPIYLNQSRFDQITITYSDGYSFYLTDFNQAFVSSNIENVAGVPSTATASYENTINAILGYDYAATFDIFDANSGIQLADNFNFSNEVSFQSFGGSSATSSPGVAFQYDLGGTLTLNATVGSGFEYLLINTSGAFAPNSTPSWSNTYYQVASYSLSAAPTPTPSPVVNTSVPSTINIGRYTANNEWVGSGEHGFHVLNSYATINLSSQLAGFMGGINRRITVSDLSGLYETPSTVLAANGEHALPFSKISDSLLQELLDANTPLKPLNYLFASDFTGYGTAQVSNYLTNTPDVLIVNNTLGKTNLHTLDLANFKGLAIVGEGININGLTEANNAIVQGDATYNMSAGDELLVLKGGGAYINGGLGVDTVYFADDTQSRSRVTEIAEDRYIVSTAQGASFLNDIERLRFKDGATAFDTGVGEHAGEAYRLYQAVFDRTPDQTGLGYWIEQLDNGASIEVVANAFINSNEFQSLYGVNSSDTLFVTNLYSNVLDRTPDQGGFQFWLDQMSQGMTRESVLVNFSESNENIANVSGLIGNGIHYQPWVSNGFITV
jgi:Domain of unknown function (DUF4214)